MKPLDFAEALALAVTILILMLAITYPVVSIYVFVIAPGHPAPFYAEAAAEWLVPWSVHISGPLIFFLAGWLFTGRARERNPYAFIAATCAWYLAIDLASFAVIPGFDDFINSAAPLWMAVQFAAGFAGVFVARLTLPPAEQPTV